MTDTRVWLVTGATSGFGRTIVDAALAHGDSVVATSRNIDGLGDLADHERVLVTRLDVTDAVERQAAVAAALERFGAPVTARPGAVAVRLHGGVDQLPDVIRALDADGLTVADFRLHAPTLDDVFLAKTGRKLEGGEPSPEPEAVPA